MSVLLVVFKAAHNFEKNKYTDLDKIKDLPLKHWKYFSLKVLKKSSYG